MAMEDTLNRIMAVGQRMMDEPNQSQDRLATAGRLLNFVDKISAMQNKAKAEEMITLDLSSRVAGVVQNVKESNLGDAVVGLSALDRSYSGTNVAGAKTLQAYYQANPQAGQLRQSAFRALQAATPITVVDSKGNEIQVTGGDLQAKAKSDFAIAQHIYNNHTTEENRGRFAELVGLRRVDGQLKSPEETRVIQAQEAAQLQVVGDLQRQRAHFKASYPRKDDVEISAMMEVWAQSNLGDYPEVQAVVGNKDITVNGQPLTYNQGRQYLAIQNAPFEFSKDLDPEIEDLLRGAQLEQLGIDSAKGSKIALRERMKTMRMTDMVMQNFKLAPNDLARGMTALQGMVSDIEKRRPIRDPETILAEEFYPNLSPERRAKFQEADDLYEQYHKQAAAIEEAKLIPDPKASEVFQHISMMAENIDADPRLSDIAKGMKSAIRETKENKEAGVLDDPLGFAMKHKKKSALLLAGPIGAVAAGWALAGEELFSFSKKQYGRNMSVLNADFRKGRKYMLRKLNATDEEDPEGDHEVETLAEIRDDQFKEKLDQMKLLSKIDLLKQEGYTSFKAMGKDSSLDGQYPQFLGSTSQGAYFDLQRAKLTTQSRERLAQMAIDAKRQGLVRVVDPATGKTGSFPPDQIPAGAQIIQ